MVLMPANQELQIRKEKFLNCDSQTEEDIDNFKFNRYFKNIPFRIELTTIEQKLKQNNVHNIQYMYKTNNIEDLQFQPK